MQRRIQILAVAIGMTALGLSALRDHPWGAYVACGCAIVVAILALKQQDDIDSAPALRKRLRRLAVIARSTDPVTFMSEHLQDVQGAVHVAGNKFGVLVNRDMSLCFVKTPFSASDLADLAKSLEALAGGLR